METFDWGAKYDTAMDACEEISRYYADYGIKIVVRSSIYSGIEPRKRRNSEELSKSGV